MIENYTPEIFKKVKALFEAEKLSSLIIRQNDISFVLDYQMIADEPESICESLQKKSTASFRDRLTATGLINRFEFNMLAGNTPNVFYMRYTLKNANCLEYQIAFEKEIKDNKYATTEMLKNKLDEASCLATNLGTALFKTPMYSRNGKKYTQMNLHQVLQELSNMQ